MIKIHYRKELFKGYSGLCESVLCAPFEDPEKFKEDDFENKRFDKLVKEGSNYIEFTPIEDCDYVIIPYKWDGKTPQNKEILSEAKLHGKKVIALYNDDYLPQAYGKECPTIEEGYIFNTTLQKSMRASNEFSMPAFTGDFFQGNYTSNRSLGFCGAMTHKVRYYTVDYIIPRFLRCLKKDFIIRKSFWATGEMSKDEARIGYLKNMNDNAFILCMRGAGNFSYRLYETMMMGRIPVIINSDQVFPFEDILDYKSFSIMIEKDDEIPNIDKIISSWLKNKTDADIINIQKKNRQIWEEYMSPLGWVKNFEKEIK